MGYRHLIAQQRLPAAAVAALAALWLVAGAAPSPPVAKPDATCAIEMFFADGDATSNIRAAPASDAKIIAQVDPTYTVARVVGVKGDWFEIASVNDYEADKDVYVGDGWIHRSILSLSVASGFHWLHERPADKSKRVFKLTPDGNILEPLDCRGNWLKVRADKKAVGWMAREAQCSNPLTTCV